MSTALTNYHQVAYYCCICLFTFHFQFDFDDANIYASFSLLDKAPIAGDVKNAEPEKDLSQAANLMESDITSGTFFVLLELQTGDVV